jgi:ribosome-associated toxin RatA of RatAB toxin-antitoxin module
MYQQIILDKPPVRVFNVPTLKEIPMTTTQNILKRIEQSWSIQKHEAQPKALPFEIQFQLQCSWGKALTYANKIAIRLRRAA